MAVVVDEVDVRRVLHEAYLELRALQVAATTDRKGRPTRRGGKGWARPVASDLPGSGYHVVDLGGDEPYYRTLLRPAYRRVRPNEVFYWCAGLGDGFGGYGDLVLRLADEPMPDLLTLDEAAELIPSVDQAGVWRTDTMTPEGVGHIVRGGGLYVIYGHKQTRYVFALQVEAVALARRARALKYEGSKSAAKQDQYAQDAHARWMELRRLLPDIHPPHTITEDLTPRPSPNPLPVTGSEERNLIANPHGRKTRQRQALPLGEDLGWWHYEGMTDDGHIVKLGRRVRRTLPSEGVLPWVLGYADSMQPRGIPQGFRVAYRPGLG